MAKKKVTHYLRQIEAADRYEELVAAGAIVPATLDGKGPPEWPDIRLIRGTVAELIDSDRGEPYLPLD